MKPRKPFGTTQPGRIPATMTKVLAAEMSDPQRHRRGKQYAKDGAVLDIIIEPGVVTCEIQGSRPTPYIASVEVTPGSGMPLRRDLITSCNCPDDGNWDGHACKHVVATLYALSNELLIEPELLDVWRSNDVPHDVADDPDDTPSGATRRHLSLVRDDHEPAQAPRPVDPLRDLLVMQPGTELPELPPIERADFVPPGDHDLATALHSALLHVRVDWD